MEIDAFMMQGDFPPYFLVRRVRGQERPLVSVMKGWHKPREWDWKFGVAVIDSSLTMALELADKRLKGRKR